MHKIGVIGDRESVRGFKAVGLDAFPCVSTEEAKKTLNKIAKEDYVIIFITEGLCKDMQETMDNYREMRLPAIIPIPGVDGNYGVGFGNLKKLVEKAVGADILFGGQ
ncbi:V-type ATP synthase subunit F [Aminipila sp.]|uniref:V-type ATP synthase subunit F n=1 Tax=Aminipila sp. TaxID=2060095 RepID=UPI002898B103|nr:V-type ATP synthase subunit F [Aminipila sp.]